MFEQIYQPLYDQIRSTDLHPWLDDVAQGIRDNLCSSSNGHLPRWIQSLERMPQATPTRLHLDQDAISIGHADDLKEDQRSILKDSLMSLHPWRKGPWSYFGMELDTEWRSNLKWDRLRQAISPLKDRLALDIGSGNGYYSYRMAGEQAKLVLGIDPYLLYVVQSLFARRYLPNTVPAWVLPFSIEQLPKSIPVFNTVFSMGVLYHRRSPLDHLLELGSLLTPSGELVLETLVVDGPEGYSLLPKGRYAKMRNTWFIPSCLTLESWLARCGYRDINLVDVSSTTPEEQRSTEWMHFDSLETFLNPEDPSKTIEGYPGPQRAIFVASK
jgi:tRNA (mo5U34)-methyltransferase